MDINGLAVSIELFFGADVLTGDGSKLSPVQWTGYMNKVRTYQGEVSDKSDLQERFRAKVAAAQAAPGPLRTHEWAEMIALIDLVRTAFTS